jgi:hypothetical protein
MSKKITFLVLALIVIFSFSLMAEMVTSRKAELSSATRDYIPGAVYITDGMTLRTFMPNQANHCVVGDNGEVLLYYSRNTPGLDDKYTGTYCFYSSDYGASFSQSPATGPVVAPATGLTWERAYTSCQLQSIFATICPLTVVNIRAPGSGGGSTRDTVIFAADLSGLGAGDWFTSIVSDNSDDLYRYMPCLLPINEAEYFVGVNTMNDGGASIHYTDDYGMTWIERKHFTLSDFSPLLGGQVLEIQELNLPKLLFREASNELVFIADLGIIFERHYTDTLGNPIIDTMEYRDAFTYSTSSDSGKTWTAFQWIVPNAIPDGYGNMHEWYYWCYSHKAIILPNEDIFLSYTRETPDAAGAIDKVFVSRYNGTTWVTDIISPPGAGPWGIEWTCGIMSNLTSDSDNNVYATWNDYTWVDETDTTAMLTIAGNKWDAVTSTWLGATIVDSTHILYTFINAADKLDGEGYVGMGIGFGEFTSGNTNDTLHYIRMHKDKYLQGIAEKKHTSVTKLDLTAPGLVRNSTTIRFSIANGGYGKLDVFDISGKLVKTLVNGNVNAGNHSVTWNRTDNNNEKVSGGVYFYKLTVGNETVTRKIVAVK